MSYRKCAWPCGRRSLRSAGNPGSFTAWLRKVTTREIANHYRNNGDRAEPTKLRDDVQETGTALEEVDGWSVVEELLAGLPPRHQLVLVLRGIKDLPFAEVGKQMGLTAEGARTLFRNGKVKISARLTAFDPKIPT